MDLLSGSESDSKDNGDSGFKINKKYAKSYEVWRMKEEKQKLIDKYGDDLDSSSEEEEIRSSHMLDKEWLRAYSVVRFNQPRLYSGEKLFKEEVKPVVKKNEKTFTLKDHERKFIVEKGGMASEDENDDFESQVGPSYFEEQEEIKNSLKKAIGDLDDNEDNEDNLFVKKTKTKEELKQEENDYLAWLKGEREDLDDKEAAKELAPLKEYWSDPNLTDKEKVLRDYILNNGYMDKEGSDDEESEDDDAFDFDKEEDFLDEADNYEKTYNFRHEEPGGIEIKTYPRVIETSVRAKEDNRRAEKRKRKMERKQKEKDQRMEEIKILRRLQKEEKEQKLQRLKDASQNPDLEYDLDADFDPEEHNKIMKKYFDDSYYQDGGPTEKPVFEEDETLDDEKFGDEEDAWWQSRNQVQMDIEEGIADNEEQEENDLYADDPGFVMDADYDPANIGTLKKSKKEKKKSKKQKKLEKIPLFDPTTKSFDEYLDEYLKDKINTLPFTYRKVIPNDFGLSTEEIFSAPDRELNSWVSVKKMSMYRSEQEEKQDIHKYRMKSMNMNKKNKILPSLNPKQSDPIVGEKAKAKKKKKKRKLTEEGEDDDNKTDSLSKSVEEEEQTETSDKIKRNEAKKMRLMTEHEQHPKTNLKKLSKDDLKSKKKKSKKGQDVKKDPEPLGVKTLPSSSDKDVDEGTEATTKKHKKKKSKKGSDIKKDTESLDMKTLPSPGDKDIEEGTEGRKATTKKHKKKKSKLKLDDTDPTAHKPITTDKKKAKGDLRKVMSVSRLSSYGLAPGVNKHVDRMHKKKKKSKKADNHQN